jgi:hypothetical protein
LDLWLKWKSFIVWLWQSARHYCPIIDQHGTMPDIFINEDYIKMSRARAQPSKFENPDQDFRGTLSTSSISSTSYERDDKYIDPRITRSDHRTVTTATSGTMSTTNSTTSLTARLSGNSTSSSTTSQESPPTDILALLPDILRAKKKDSAIAPFFDYLSLYQKAQLAGAAQFSKFDEYKQAALKFEKLSTALVEHVVRGEQKEAEEMIIANPELLLMRARVKDYSGRTIEATPLQAAAGSDDGQMEKMIQGHLSKLEDGEKEEKRQRQE